MLTLLSRGNRNKNNKQAGAELCQSQFMLKLDKPDIDCLQPEQPAKVDITLGVGARTGASC